MNRFNILIRKAKVSDMNHITNIYNYYVENTTSTFDIETVDVEDRLEWFKKFDNVNNPLFVSVIKDNVGNNENGNDKIIGYSGYMDFKTKMGYNVTRETTIYIDKDYHGYGVGSKLYSTLIKHAKENDRVYNLLGIVGGNNQNSIDFHEKMGFELIAHLPKVGYKFDEFQDTRYMQLFTNQ
eukprot:TRINITY_DN1984_c0_g1_i1.p1 TRINITY_DN1984_c0_g1~~TRINITY_DN1984_c0_g1_i1.p1  ORF type:complete len:181 (-),score=20.32 TRINITY_DN1984_c0_g1_i1:595-1137(-)